MLKRNLTPSLDEALTTAALMVREAALREGFSSKAGWRAADAIVRAATANLHDIDPAPTGAEAARADQRCNEIYPPLTLTEADIAAVRSRGKGPVSQYVSGLPFDKSRPRVKSLATCPIEEIGH